MSAWKGSLPPTFEDAFRSRPGGGPGSTALEVRYEISGAAPIRGKRSYPRQCVRRSGSICAGLHGITEILRSECNRCENSCFICRPLLSQRALHLAGQITQRLAVNSLSLCSFSGILVASSDYFRGYAKRHCWRAQRQPTSKTARCLRISAEEYAAVAKDFKPKA